MTNLSQNFGRKSKKLVPEFQKFRNNSKNLFSKNNLSEKIPWTLESSFGNPTRLLSPKIRNDFLKVWKQLKILKSLWKRKIFLRKCSMDTKKTVLTNMSKKFYKTPKLFPQNPLVGVNFLEENDNVMPEDPLKDCREQFFKSGRTPSDRSSQSFSLKLEKILKMNFFFRKHTFLEKFCCSSKMHFWQLLLGFCANVAECSSHSRKTAKKLKKFIEKTVHSTISFGHTKCSFDEPAESSYRTPKTFSFKFRRKTWIFSHEKNNLTHKFFSYSIFFDKNLEIFW